MTSFLITIDAEGDNLWSPQPSAMTCNAGHLPRFQALCERHRLRPTYLTNFEMARSEAFVEFARDVVRRGAGEVGMHLHAWNSPPLASLPGSAASALPYLIEYPEPVMRDKIVFMTHLLQDTFGVPMVSHRAGRWALNAPYAKILHTVGYRVDCSVTPLVDWTSNKGHFPGRGGADYRRFPDRAYFLDLDDIARPGASALLELPMTIVQRVPKAFRILMDPNRGAGFGRLGRALFPISWLRPNGRNRASMLRLLDQALADKRDYVEFMLHSSELMPGGSPRFPTEDSIERLYDDLDALFGHAARRFRGETLAEFRFRHDAPPIRGA